MNAFLQTFILKVKLAYFMPGKAVRKGKKLIFRKHQLFPSYYFIMFFFKYLIWVKVE